MKFVLVLMLLPGLAFAEESLTDKLYAELSERGQTTFSDLEIALIASGVDSAESLDTYKGKYQALLDKLSLSDKQQRQKGKKKARTLHKMLFEALVKEDGEANLATLLDNGSYNTLSASYVFAALARRDGVAGEDFDAIKDGVDVNMLKAIDERTMSAAFFIPKAESMSDDQAQEIRKTFKIAKMLAPKSSFGVGRYDVQFYNRVLLLHNEGDQIQAAYIGAAAADFYPARKEFASLCFNVGLKMFQENLKTGDLGQLLEVGEMLGPYTGSHRSDFDKIMETMYYNHSVNLYNKGKYEEALAMVSKSSPDQPGYETVTVGSIEKLINKALEEQDEPRVQELLTQLDGVSAERGKRMRARMDQLRLQALDAAGLHEEAVELALKDVDSDIGKNNYIAVVTKYVQKMRDEKGIEATLSYLDTDVPEVMKEHETVKGLRFNTYVAWLEQYKDEQYKKLIPIYKKALADEKLELSEKDKNILMEGYGNALYREVEYLIAEREWKKADSKSKAALKAVPDHARLLEQRQLVETILRRVSED